MKIEITQAPEITYTKVVYLFKAKIQDIEYKIGRRQDSYGEEIYIEPRPKKEEVNTAIENLFTHKDFHYNTTQEGTEFTL